MTVAEEAAHPDPPRCMDHELQQRRFTAGRRTRSFAPLPPDAAPKWAVPAPGAGTSTRGSLVSAKVAAWDEQIAAFQVDPDHHRRREAAHAEDPEFLLALREATRAAAMIPSADVAPRASDTILAQLRALTTALECREAMRAHCLRLLRYALRETAVGGVEDIELHIFGMVLGGVATCLPQPSASCEARMAAVLFSDGAVDPGLATLGSIATLSAIGQLTALARQAAGAGAQMLAPVVLKPRPRGGHTTGEAGSVVGVAAGGLLDDGELDPSWAEGLIEALAALGYGVKHRFGRQTRDGRPVVSSAGRWAVQHAVQLSWDV